MADVQTAVATSIVVEAPIERAFAVFTEDMDSWWPKEHHILQTPLARMVFEPRVGGAIYDVGTDGSECRWARVLAYEPPHRIVFSWDISMQWQIETDPAKTSEVEVRFLPDGPGAHPGRARAPSHRPPRRGLGVDARRGRLGRRLEGRTGCLRTAACSGEGRERRLTRLRCQASLVAIRQAPRPVQATIQPTITEIIAHVGMAGMPSAPRPPRIARPGP